MKTNTTTILKEFEELFACHAKDHLCEGRIVHNERTKLFTDWLADKLQEVERAVYQEVRDWVHKHCSYTENSDLDPSPQPIIDAKEIVLFIDERLVHLKGEKET